MEEAICSHRVFCQKFNTTRLSLKLSLTCAVRDMTKRSSENRSSRNLCKSRIARSISCVPRIDFNH
ncbi:hypothetical protein SADUNF_Sadunf06G0189900 [Salix dunnii]|uniref:Uncharacterized protein n=1 Tax=Salix dunnii TaxID=1413687 RepID=A0A835MXP1_9ROSI|nr:hypothetical protein SADUNF_Sadunf06G0189900 [Salix dunnii]